MKRDRFEHRFVEGVPAKLEEAVLYVSIRFRTSSHLCACGCGNKVVTPIRPPRWHLKFNGDTVSLAPSVGSWQFPCRSHYWIKHGQVKWALPWTDEQVAAGRARDEADMRLYYEKAEVDTPEPSAAAGQTNASWTTRIKRLFRRG